MAARVGADRGRGDGEAAGGVAVAAGATGADDAASPVAPRSAQPPRKPSSDTPVMTDFIVAWRSLAKPLRRPAIPLPFDA